MPCHGGKRSACHTGFSLIQFEGLQNLYSEWSKLVLQFSPGLVNPRLGSGDLEEFWKGRSL